MRIPLLFVQLLVVFAIAGIFGATGPASAGEQIGQSTEPIAKPIPAESLFRSDRVVDIQIRLAPQDWDSIRTQTRSFAESLGKAPVESPFTWARGSVAIDGVLIEDIGIRKKGFLGSLDDYRPSLKISFSKYRPQQPIAGLNRLTLNNNKQDAARFCQFLAYRLFRDSGTVAPRCGFARVTVNDEYLGIYSNVESIRKPFLKRNFGRGSGGLYEGTVNDFFPQWIRRFEKKNEAAKFRHLQAVAEILQADEVDLERLREVVDIEAFVRFWAMESLIGFWDGYCSNQNNYFVYRNPENSRFYFMPWGADSCFSQTTPLPPYRIRPRSVHARAILPNRLYRIPEIRELYTQTLMSFLDEHWNEEKLLAEVDRLEGLLGEHLHEDNDGFDKQVKSYRQFITSRRRTLLREFRDGPPELRSREHLPVYFVEMGRADVSFATRWYDRTPAQKLGLGEVDLKLELNGETVEFEQVGVYAEKSKWPSLDRVPPPSIVIVGKRKSDGQIITLGTGLSRERFRPTRGTSVEIGGILIVGNRLVDSRGRMRMIGGKAEFEQASTENRQAVQGTMQLKIMQMKGGAPPPEEEK